MVSIVRRRNVLMSVREEAPATPRPENVNVSHHLSATTVVSSCAQRNVQDMALAMILVVSASASRATTRKIAETRNAPTCALDQALVT